MKSSRLAKVRTRLLSSLGTGNRYFRIFIVWRKKETEIALRLVLSRLVRGKYGLDKTLVDKSLKLYFLLPHPLSEPALEVVEYEVRVLLRHVAKVGDVMPHDHVGNGEIGGGPEWQVADDEPVRLAAVLVDHDEVSNVVGAAGLDQLLELVVAAV